MFLKTVKFFFIKKSLKKSLQDTVMSRFVGQFSTVGLLIEKINLGKVDVILDVLLANGFDANNISVLVFDKRKNDKQSSTFACFGCEEVNYKGAFKEGICTEFIHSNFDLLINYYQDSNPLLLAITNQSKASFKAGLPINGYLLNDLIIQTSLDNEKAFANELIKYIKILKNRI
ncbi:DUF6913 domain-containing protein [Flavobacterium agrisoli]|uniref:Uncharacterized protein n=1 Tax=Flavobacterium agrisoli TaxID=2793066 RepID=A0A934UIX4_9FLAO|nr:hypothetical protein [Flavobacterium agrisoli]MBK0369014.1 hypothetical protein [Flavobacterium agrisoli]